MRDDVLGTDLFSGDLLQESELNRLQELESIKEVSIDLLAGLEHAHLALFGRITDHAKPPNTDRGRTVGLHLQEALQGPERPWDLQRLLGIGGENVLVDDELGVHGFLGHERGVCFTRSCVKLRTVPQSVLERLQTGAFLQTVRETLKEPANDPEGPVPLLASALRSSVHLRVRAAAEITQFLKTDPSPEMEFEFLQVLLDIITASNLRDCAQHLQAWILGLELKASDERNLLVDRITFQALGTLATIQPPKKASYVDFWSRLLRSGPGPWKPRAFIGLRLQDVAAGVEAVPELLRQAETANQSPGPLLHGLWNQKGASDLLIEKVKSDSEWADALATYLLPRLKDNDPKGYALLQSTLDGQPKMTQAYRTEAPLPTETPFPKVIWHWGWGVSGGTNGSTDNHPLGVVYAKVTPSFGNMKEPRSRASGRTLSITASWEVYINIPLADHHIEQILLSGSMYGLDPTEVLDRTVKHCESLAPLLQQMRILYETTHGTSR